MLVLCASCSFGSSGCSFGGVRPDFDLQQVPGTLKFRSDRDWASEMVDGRYRLFNNVWNSGAISGEYRQDIFVKDEGGKSTFGWVWSIPSSGAPATYPEIQAGYSPWGGRVVADSGFPFAAGTKKLVADYDVTLSASGSYSVSLQFWAVSALPPAKETITHEVIILLAHQGMPMSGTEVGQATVQGRTYRIHVDKNHRDATGKNGNTWTLVSLVPDRPVLHGPFDVSAVVDLLLAQGHLAQQTYVANLELGSDIMRGNGNVAIRNFAVTVH